MFNGAAVADEIPNARMAGVIKMLSIPMVLTLLQFHTSTKRHRSAVSANPTTAIDQLSLVAGSAWGEPAEKKQCRKRVTTYRGQVAQQRRGAAVCGEYREAAGVVAQAVIRSVELIVQPGAKDGVGEMGVRGDLSSQRVRTIPQTRVSFD